MVLTKLLNTARVLEATVSVLVLSCKQLTTVHSTLL